MFRLHANPTTMPMRLRFVETPAEGGGSEEAAAPSETPSEESTPAESGEASPDGEKPTADEAPESEGADTGIATLPEWAQAELKRARSEAASYRTQLREVQEQLKSAKTPEEWAEAEKNFSDLLRAKDVELVKERYKLPPELASRLQGNTLEELEADAKSLAKFARVGAVDEGSLGGGLEPGDSDDPFDPVAEARRAKARRY